MKILLAAIVATTSGCQLQVGEAPLRETNLSVGGAGECLGEVGEVVSEFFRAELKDAEVSQFMDCLIESVELFGMHTRGAHEEYQTSQEVRNFLHRYFLQEKPLSDEFLARIMDLKQAFVGGSADRITPEELKSLQHFLKDFKKSVVQLNPHMSHINWDVGFRDRDKSAKNWGQARLALREALMQVGRSIGHNGGGAYNLQNLESLLWEFRKYVEWEEVFTNTRPAYAWSDFVQHFKTLTTGSSDKTLEAREWEPLLVAAADWYSLWLRYLYQVRNQDLFYGKGRVNLAESVHQLLDLTNMAVDAQPEKVINYQDMNLLAERLSHLRFLPENIRLESIEGILPHILGRIFGDLHVHPEQRSAPGLNRFAMAQAASEFERFIEIQKYLDGVFSPEASGRGYVDWQTGRMGPMETLNTAVRTALQTKDIYFRDIHRITQKVRPLFRSGESRVFLVEEEFLNRHNVIHGFYNLSMMNIARAVMNLLTRGYSSYINRIWTMDAGISEDEMQKFYEHFRPLGIDLKLMDPRSYGSGRRSFMEANLFTYQAQGWSQPNGSTQNPLMSFEQGMEYFSFIWSGGQLAGNLYREMLNVCRTGPEDVLGQLMLDRPCVREQLLLQLQGQIANMPEMQGFLSQIPVEDRDEFIDVLIETVYHPQHSHPDWIEKGEIDSIAMILHYSEAIMTRYNVNHDNILDKDEVMAAFPVFEGLIRKLAEKTLCRPVSDWLVKAIFSYTVKYAEVPSGSLEEMSRMTWFSTVGWSFELDRLGVTKVFSAIVRKTSQVAQGEERSCTDEELDHFQQVERESRERLIPFVAP